VNVLFAVAGIVAIVSTVLVVVQRNAVHALLYLIISLFALAVAMFLLGAPFVAALEIIVYAGAILVLFVFVVMMIGARSAALDPKAWAGPSVLGAALLAEIVYVVVVQPDSLPAPAMHAIDPKEVGIALMGPYLIGVEIAAFLLLAGLVGAYHLGRRREGKRKPESREGVV
jgi:NADH-quinone oxidoreductase subunit J